MYTFASAPNPSSILPGWNGSATTVTLRINDNAQNDFVTILNASTGTQLAGLGSVSLGADYADRQDVTATGSTMSLSGNIVTVVLGATTGKAIHQKKAVTMVWTAPSGSATSSGPAAVRF